MHFTSANEQNSSHQSMIQGRTSVLRPGPAVSLHLTEGSQTRLDVWASYVKTKRSNVASRWAALFLNYQHYSTKYHT